MSLGIYTRYSHCEATYTALRLADWATETGIPVSLFSDTARPVSLRPQWDHNVRGNLGSRFTQWAPRQSTIIWTHCPIVQQIRWAKQHKIKTGLFCLWNELKETDSDSYAAADFIISPSEVTAKFVDKVLKPRQSWGVPWDVGEPVTQRDQRIQSRECWLLLPLMDYEVHNMEGTALELAGRALQRFDDVVLTVAYNSSTIAPFATRRMQQFRRQFGDRVQLITQVPLHKRPSMFAAHDLTIWPVSRHNTGMTGLLSITMGTPVIAFRMPLLAEFLSPTNSVLVESRIQHNELGIPQLDHPDFPYMEQCLHGLLRDRVTLRMLQQSAAAGLEHRRDTFETILTRLVH